MPLSTGSRFLLAFSLWWPSVGLVLKFMGVVGALAYSLVVLSLPTWLPVLARGVEGRVSRAGFATAATLIAMILLVLFAVVFPRADSQLPGHGSDEDEALDVAASALLHGRYPYEDPTYLGNPIAPLPGAVVLATPFAALGTSALQAFLWLPVLAVATAKAIKDRALTTLLWLTVLVCCPEIVRALVTGSDPLQNGIYVAVLSLVVVNLAHDDGGTAPSNPARRRLARLLAAAAWGVSLSSRALFFPVAVVVVLAVALRTRVRDAVEVALIGGASFLLVTTPFYLIDPSGFTPLETASKLTLGGQLPAVVGLGLFAAALAFALTLCVRRRPPTAATTLLACVVALGLPLIALTLIYTALAGQLAFIRYATYGITVVPFVLLVVADEIGDLTNPQRTAALGDAASSEHERVASSPSVRPA
jgi:hypothetical protein